jgi:guanine deaminase
MTVVSIFDCGGGQFQSGRGSRCLSFLFGAGPFCVDRFGTLERKMSDCICRCGQAHVVGRRGAISLLIRAGIGGVIFNAAPAFAKAVRLPIRPEDESFMRLAIAEAAKADLPFGVVIVRDGKVLSTGRNLGKTNNDPTAHGEMVAIRKFVAERPAAELEGATIYTSGELGRVVYAASIDELATRLG